MLSYEEFKKKFLSLSNDMQKIKLAIRERRYAISRRPDKPNLIRTEPLEALLKLPDTYPVEKAPRTSKESGAPQVLVVKYTAKVMGRSLQIYLKAFFKASHRVSLHLKIQSYRKDD